MRTQDGAGGVPKALQQRGSEDLRTLSAGAPQGLTATASGRRYGCDRRGSLESSHGCHPFNKRLESLLLSSTRRRLAGTYKLRVKGHRINTHPGNLQGGDKGSGKPCYCKTG